MLWTLFVILLVLWFLGLVTSYTLGGFIHILLVVAVAVLLIQVITGRRVGLIPTQLRGLAYTNPRSSRSRQGYYGSHTIPQYATHSDPHDAGRQPAAAAARTKG